jgi:hypothetical protein
MKIQNVVFTMLAGSLAPGTALAQENYAQWAASQTITLNTSATGANVSADVTRFPLAVRLTATNFPFAAAKGNGADIRFTKADGVTRLKHQIERWDSAGKNALVWVLADTVKGNSTAQTLKLYWGKSDAADSSRGSAVFETSNGFAGVWHLSNNNFSDATSNANNGSDVGTTNVAGILGQGRSMEGSATGDPQYISVPDAPSLNITNNLTLSTWVWGRSFETNNRIIQKNNTQNGDDQYRLFIAEGGLMLQLSPNGNEASPVAEFPSPETWHLIHATFNSTVSSTASANIYLDGVLAASADIGGDIQLGNPELGPGELWIGAKPQAAVTGDYSNAIFDEARVHNVARGANWIKLEYANQKAAQNLLTTSLVLGVNPRASRGAAEFSAKSAGKGLVFSVPGGAAGPLRVSLVDVWGRTVWSGTADKGARTVAWNGITANGNRAAPGLYVARLSSAGKSVIAESKVLYNP